MNFSRLMKTMAFMGLVGFGSQVLAVQGGDDLIKGDTFEGYTVGPFEPQTGGLTGWTATGGDLSEIVTDFVTAFGAMPECGGYAVDEKGQLLELNTEGEDLTFAAVSTDLATAYVDTMLKVVGSDTAPEITDAQVQTAVYLNTTDSKLYAWSSLEESIGVYTNGWTQMAAATVADGEWICLQIAIDYVSEYGQGKPMATVKVNGVAAGASYIVANKVTSFTKLNIASVSFRGTGMVDNFTVSETPQDLELATIITQSVDADGVVIGSFDNTPGVEYEIEVDTYNAMFAASPAGFAQYELSSVRLVGPDFTNALSNPVSLPVTAANSFVDGQTYYVQGVYTIKTFDVTVDYQGVGAPTDPAPVTKNYGETFTLDLNGVVVLDGTLEIYCVELADYYYVGDAEITAGVLSIANVTQDLTVQVNGTYPSSDPIVITDNNSLTFGEIVFGSPTNTVSFTAAGTVTSSPATMYLIASTNLALGVAGEFPIEVNVTATVGSPVVGTVEIDPADLTGYDTFFIKGLGTAP